jgi:hypothetical protein
MISWSGLRRKIERMVNPIDEETKRVLVGADAAPKQFIRTAIDTGLWAERGER